MKAEVHKERSFALLKDGHYSLAIELDPSDPRVFCSRGNAYLKMGRNEEAAADFRQILSVTDDAETVRKARRALRDLCEE